MLRFVVFYFLISALLIVGMVIARDWLIYKHRGRAQPDDPQDQNPPIVTGPEDARAQRLMDLYQQKKSDSQKK